MDNYKFTVVAIAGVVLVTVLLGAFGKKDISLSGFTTDSPNFGVDKVTNGVVTCTPTSTLVVATSSGRMSFMAWGLGGNQAYLCRTGGSTCSATSGIPVALSSTSNVSLPFVQGDGYTGPYRCSSPASSTLNYSQSE